MKAFKVVDEKFFRSEGIKRMEYHIGIGFDIETVAGSTVFLTDQMLEQMYAEMLLRKVRKDE